MDDAHASRSQPDLTRHFDDCSKSDSAGYLNCKTQLLKIWARHPEINNTVSMNIQSSLKNAIEFKLEINNNIIT